MVETTAERIGDPQGIEPGTVISGYRVLRLIGEGGMGRVFLAEDVEGGTKVALKVLTDDRPMPKAAERFIREAQSIERIDHAHVVSIFDVGESPRGGLFYVMEFLEGEELADILEREGPLPWWRAREIGLQVCSALQAAHEKGIVHRDLKLENCFRVERGGRDDFIKILDFGVAKLLGPVPDSDNGGRLTNTGATLGTPVYMAPEQCRGKDVDHRVDIYALGVMLYELLVGHPPFEGEAFLDVALMHMNDEPPPLRGQLEPEELPAGFETVIMRALAKAREDRWPTMAAFGRALEAVEHGPQVVTPAPDESARMPITAPGGTEPALDSLSMPSAPISGGTVPFLPGMDDDESELYADRGRVRRGGLLGVLIGAAVAVGALMWWRPFSPAESDDAQKSEAKTASIDDADTVPTPTPRPGDDAEPMPSPTETREVNETSAAQPVTRPETHSSRKGPKGLTKGEIRRGLHKVKGSVSACAGGITKVAAGQKVRVVVTVDRASGRVKRVKASMKGGSTAAEICVADAVKKAKFSTTGTGEVEFARSLTL